MAMTSSNRRHYIGATIFIVFNALVFFYWSGFVANNTKFEHGYTSLATQGPGPFVSTRYGWDWAFIFVLSVNGLLPMLLQMALTDSDLSEYARIHAFFSGVMLIANGVLFVGFLIRWCISCNWWHSWASTACNDYKWCGVYYAASVQAINICANNVPFVPNVVAANLHINGEYVQHLIASAVFGIMAYANIAVSSSLSSFGIFGNQ